MFSLSVFIFFFCPAASPKPKRCGGKRRGMARIIRPYEREIGLFLRTNAFFPRSGNARRDPFPRCARPRNDPTLYTPPTDRLAFRGDPARVDRVSFFFLSPDVLFRSRSRRTRSRGRRSGQSGPGRPLRKLNGPETGYLGFFI